MKAVYAYDNATSRESAVATSLKQLGENGHLKHNDDYEVVVFDPSSVYTEPPEGYDTLEDFQNYMAGLKSENKFVVVVRIGPKKEVPPAADETAILEFKAMKRVAAYQKARDEFRNTGDAEKFEEAVEEALRLE